MLPKAIKDKAAADQHVFDRTENLERLEERVYSLAVAAEAAAAILTEELRLEEVA